MSASLIGLFSNGPLKVNDCKALHGHLVDGLIL